ncbi:MAG: hypothetical protein AAF202_01135, partial [Pseudomonadota bacterium]
MRSISAWLLKSLKVALCVSQIFYVSVPAHAEIQDVLQGNFITPDQQTFGKWTPDSWVEGGWTGYHIIAKTRKARRTVSYSCGDDCTRWIRNAQGGTDLCPDGDCRYSKEAYIYQIGEGAFEGKRVTGAGYLGAYVAEDSGSVETSAIVNIANDNIARFDETEAQQQNLITNLRFSEAQVTTLMGFDQTGAAIPRGHIEEADAPWQINQTESYYKMTPAGPEFATTVVERIYTTEVDGSEGIRGGTFWCPVDEFQLTTDSWKSIFKNDDFNFQACKEARGQIYSDGSNEIAQAFQAGESRVNSQVSLMTSNNQTFNYSAGSNKCGLGGFSLDCNGTQYHIDVDTSEGEKRAVHVNSERIAWSMKNTSEDIFGTFSNFPNAKLISLNFEGKDRFKGIKDYDDWMANENDSALAMVLYEKTDEMYSANLDGDVCVYESGETGTYKFAGQELGTNEAIARACKMFKQYT